MAFVPGSGSFGARDVPFDPEGVKPTDTYFSFGPSPSPPQTYSTSMSMPPPPGSSSALPATKVKSEMFIPGSGSLVQPSMPPPPMTPQFRTESIAVTESVPAPQTSFTTQTIVSAPQASFTTQTVVPASQASFTTQTVEPNYMVPKPSQFQPVATEFIPNSTVLSPETITTPRDSFPPAAPPVTPRQYQSGAIIDVSAGQSFIPASQAILPPPTMQSVPELQSVSYAMPPPSARSFTPPSAYGPPPVQSMPYQPPQQSYQPPAQSYLPPPQPQRQQSQPFYTRGGTYDNAPSKQGADFGGVSSFLPEFVQFGGQIEEQEKFLSRRPLGFAQPRIVQMEDVKHDDWYEDACDWQYMADPKITSGHAWYERNARATQQKKMEYLPDAHGFEAEALMQHPEDFRVRPYMGMLEIEGRDDRDDNCRMA